MAIGHFGPLWGLRSLDQVSRPVTYRGRQLRALRLGDAADVVLLTAISRGSLRLPAFATATSAASSIPASLTADRAASARVTRQLRLLRAHGVIKKIPKTHRYRLTNNGHLLAAAVSFVREATLEELVGTAAA